MKKATPNRFLTAGRPGVFKVKMSLGRAMKTTDLNGGLIGGFGTLGPASRGLMDMGLAELKKYKYLYSNIYNTKI